MDQKFILENGAVVVVAVAVWFIGLAFDLGRWHEFVVAMTGAFLTYALIGLYKLESVIKENAAAVQTAKILESILHVLQTGEELPRQIALKEFRYFEKFFHDAALGRTIIKSAHSTLLNYADFFKAAKDGARMKATVLMVPSSHSREVIKNANKEFIQRAGSVERIFLIPEGRRSETQEQAWQDYINEHREIGVKCMFLPPDSRTPAHLKEDILVLSAPRVATHAQPAMNGGEYASVVLIMDAREIGQLEYTWDELEKLAIQCDSNDCLVRYLHPVTPTASIPVDPDKGEAKSG